MKLRMLLKDIIINEIFGQILSYVYVIEFQKRGLPHAHILFTLNYGNKLITPEKIDKVISAEIPKNDEVLKELVIRHMLHGPRTENTLSYNVKTKHCSKSFPNEFSNSTLFHNNGFPIYKRSNNISDCNYYNNKVNGKLVPVDNSMVVSYNPYLLKKYKSHINVEYCASVMSTKYIYKYIHKGQDRAFIQIGMKSNKEIEIYDEVSDYMSISAKNLHLYVQKINKKNFESTPSRPHFS